MDTGDFVAIFEAFALAGTWYWVLRRPMSFDGARRKLAISGLGLASVAVLLDLALTVIMHVHKDPNDVFAAKAFLVVLSLSTLSALAGLGCGIVAKGTPRIAAIVWSVIMLAVSTISIYQVLLQAE